MMARGYNWGGFTPWKHQRTIFEASAARPAYALLMEMRTGKTPVVIHTAAFLKSRGEIDGVLVMAPNYLKSEWQDQFAQHAPDWLEANVIVWKPTTRIEQTIRELRPNGQLNVLIMNEEAFSTQRGTDVAATFLYNHTALYAIDEATCIANPKAKRTKNVMKLRGMAPYRRILTGTPITRGPLDLWAPFYFLDPAILGFKTWFGMRNAHAVLGGFKGKEIMGYVKLDALQNKIAPHSARVLRSDVVKNMPPKIHRRVSIPFDTNPEQARIYRQMRDTMIAEWEGKRLEAAVILSQLLRLSQITGGYVPAEGEEKATAIPGPNPKLEALLELIAQTDEKVVIFSRFRAELAAISAALRAKYGEDSVAEFHGGISEADRPGAKRSFMNPKGARFFVANQASARMGLDLSVASLVIYLTNSFNLLDRLQTEDRTETVARSKGSTTYVDLVIEETLDEKVLQALAAKVSLSDLITGDNVRLNEWI